MSSWLLRTVNHFILCNPFISDHNILSSLLCNSRLYNNLLQTYSDDLSNLQSVREN